MTDRSKAFQGISKYFHITEADKHYEIRCKVCRRGWALPFDRAENFNPLNLYEHALAHKERKDRNTS
jgi:hypothetical protein